MLCYRKKRQHIPSLSFSLSEFCSSIVKFSASREGLVTQFQREVLVLGVTSIHQACRISRLLCDNPQGLLKITLKFNQSVHFRAPELGLTVSNMYDVFSSVCIVSQIAQNNMSGAVIHPSPLLRGDILNRTIHFPYSFSGSRISDKGR